jgi:signal transduction histidine kinase
VGQGTGLGLPVVHGIVTSHGGSISVESNVNQGTRFEIQLPLTRLQEMQGNNSNGPLR